MFPSMNPTSPLQGLRQQHPSSKEAWLGRPTCGLIWTFGFCPGTVVASNSGSSRIFCTNSMKHCRMPSFVFAEASKNSIPCARAHASASSLGTFLSKSILFPTNSLTTDSPLFGAYRWTSLSHWSRFSNVSVRVTSYTKQTPWAPR